MNYAQIRKHDVANGPGIRVSLFVSGCHHHCKGCFNEETWDFNYGEPFTEDNIDEILDALEPDYVSGLTLLGGEPFEYSNQQGLLPLMRKFKKRFPNKNVWCYTGFTYEKDILNDMIPKWPEAKELLSYIDIMVDGKFDQDLKDLSLRFKGSSNQRIINVKESIKLGETVLWDGKGNITNDK